MWKPTGPMTSFHALYMAGARSVMNVFATITPILDFTDLNINLYDIMSSNMLNMWATGRLVLEIDKNFRFHIIENLTWNKLYLPLYGEHQSSEVKTVPIGRMSRIYWDDTIFFVFFEKILLCRRHEN